MFTSQRALGLLDIIYVDTLIHMGVSIAMGIPNSWMVYKGTSQSKTDENWGYPYDSGNLHMYTVYIC